MIQKERLIGKLSGKQGPCLIMIGGVHGNEASGVKALSKVCHELQESKTELQGSFYALKGNLAALAQQKRYLDTDLNRLWNRKIIKEVQAGTFQAQTAEENELQQLYSALQEILQTEAGPFYFIDLHTTSAQTIPFLTVNDALLNRAFTLHYPVPIILGIEEYIQGPLLSYINELGYVAFGFEGGQHDDQEAYLNHYHFIYRSMEIIGLKKSSSQHYDTLKKHSKGIQGFYEIISRFGLEDQDEFQMLGNYQNFELIAEKEHFANFNGKALKATEAFRIFMPLYQKQGGDGYFSIRKIPAFFMQLSAFLRKRSADRILPLLPGIAWHDRKRSALIINRKVARFLAKQLFHLLGYRNKELDQNHWLMYNREHAARNEEYKGAEWIGKFF